MTYHFTKRLKAPFDAAIDRITEALKQHGFGILTDIDVQQTLKKKLGVDFRPYRILGLIRRSPIRRCRPRTRSARCCRAM